MTESLHRYAVRMTPPASEPLSLAEVKTFLRIDGSADDSILTTLIASARIMAEELTGKSLITQSWKLAYDDAVPACVKLIYLPLQAISSVVAINDAEESTTINSTQYQVNAARGSTY